MSTSKTAHPLVMCFIFLAQCNIASVDCEDADPSCSKEGLIGYIITVLTRTRLPDTGLTQCYDSSGSTIACGDTSFPGQDGDYNGIPGPRSFTLQSSQLSVLEETSELYWQRCPRNATNDCTGSAINDTQTNQQTYCQGLVLDGLSWRLPEIRELIFLADYGKNTPAFDAALFPQTGAGPDIWSSTTFAFNGTDAWELFTSNGRIGQAAPGGFNYMAQCVSGSPLSPQWTMDPTNGVAFDQTSLLMATRCGLSASAPDDDGAGGCLSSGTVQTWQQALQVCDSLIYAGHSDWRLPNLHELVMIMNFQNANPAVDSVVFPATHFSGSRYWSSTTDVSNALSALAIDFSDSTIYSTGKTGNHYVRCVR